MEKSIGEETFTNIIQKEIDRRLEEVKNTLNVNNYNEQNLCFYHEVSKTQKVKN